MFGYIHLHDLGLITPTLETSIFLQSIWREIAHVNGKTQTSMEVLPKLPMIKFMDGWMAMTQKFSMGPEI